MRLHRSPDLEIGFDQADHVKSAFSPEFPEADVPLPVQTSRFIALVNRAWAFDLGWDCRFQVPSGSRGRAK